MDPPPSFRYSDVFEGLVHPTKSLWAGGVSRAVTVGSVAGLEAKRLG